VTGRASADTCPRSRLGGARGSGTDRTHSDRSNWALNEAWGTVIGGKARSGPE